MRGYLAKLVTRAAASLSAANGSGLPRRAMPALPRTPREAEGARAPLPQAAQEPATLPATQTGVRQSAAEFTTRETSNLSMSVESRKEAPPAGSPAQQRTTGEAPVLDTPTILHNQHAVGAEPASRVRTAWMPLAQSPVPAAASESLPISPTAAGVGHNAKQDFLKRPPKIEVERARGLPTASESTLLTAQAPAAILKRAPRVVTERPGTSERVAAKPLGHEKESLPPPFQPKAQPSKAGGNDDQRASVQAASPARPLSETGRPARQQVATESLPAKSAAAARQTEWAQPSSRPPHQSPAQEKRPEGPRLSIGRLEIQIIQENPTANTAGRDAGRENSPDVWEQMDRHHLRRLGGV